MIDKGILLTELNPIKTGDTYRFFDIQGRDGMNNIQIDIQIQPSTMKEVNVTTDEGAGIDLNISMNDLNLGGEINFDEEEDNDKKC